MQLTDKNITDFQAIYLKTFGVEISKEKALKNGLQLVRLVQITLEHKVKKQAEINTDK